MQPTTYADPTASMTQLLQQFMRIFGKDITLAKVRQIPGISVSDDGRVLQTQSDPTQLLHQIQIQFNELSPFVVQKASAKALSETSTLLDSQPVPPPTSLESSKQKSVSPSVQPSGLPATKPAPTETPSGGI